MSSRAKRGILCNVIIDSRSRLLDPHARSLVAPLLGMTDDTFEPDQAYS